MRLRPADASGDILPVLSSSILLFGPEAVTLLVQDWLSLLQGEWWENPENGFFILETMRESECEICNMAAVKTELFFRELFRQKF